MTMPRTSLLIIVLLISAETTLATATTFTYQGYLTEAGTAADGAFDFELAL